MSNDLITIPDDLDADEVADLNADGFDILAARTDCAAEDEGTPVPVRNRLGEPQFYTKDGQTLPVQVWMAGKNSRRYRAKRREQQKRPLNQGKKLTEGKFHDDAMELVVACVIRWEGIRAGDRFIDANEHNVTQFFKASPWNYDDCTEAMNDPERFSKSSSPQQ